MRFEELLKGKLPSQMMVESQCEDPDKDEACKDEACKDEACGPKKDECVGSESCVKNEDGLDPMDDTDLDDDDLDDDIEDDLDSIDLDNTDEDELDEISEDDLTAVGDDDDEEDLSDEEEVEADKTMAIAATPILLDKELNESTYESFLDEFPAIVSEGLLMESDLDMYLENPDDDAYMERAFAPKTKVMFSEKDRKKQLFEVGVQASARAHNDPVYWKLQKVYKLERKYKAILRQKYRGEALKRVKTYIKRLKASKSKVLSGIANKLTGK